MTTTSIRRTQSPYSDRSSHSNGSNTNNPFSTQSPSHKLIFNGKPTLSPLNKFIAGVLLHKPRKPQKSILLRCFLFFFVGFVFGIWHFNNNDVLKNNEFSFEFKSPNSPLVNEKPSIVIEPVEFAEKKVFESVRKQLIVVTPTYNRALQAYYLNRLGQVLRLVKPQVLWIVVESNVASTETAEILRNMGVMYRHLVCRKNSTDVKDRGVHQRNTALEHVERHKLDGIVYFADDDNIYSLELFESLREISRFGIWPVGMLAQRKNKAILEGPVCNGSQVIGWHTNEKSKRLRRFHVDMSGFAFNSTILWDPKRWHRPTSDTIRQLDTVKEGFQETTFIEQVVENESQMEGVPLGRGCSKIMNWHLHLDLSGIVYPDGWILEKNLDVVLPSK